MKMILTWYGSKGSSRWRDLKCGYKSGLRFQTRRGHPYYVKKIVSSIGTPLAMDIATNGRTRPSIAKIGVEIDLLKSHPENVWVGLEYEASPLRGYYKKLEYKNKPK